MAATKCTAAVLWYCCCSDVLVYCCCTAGSPVVQAVQERLQGIEKEYQELDTVWFMAGSLFNRYPFDIPTEAFSFKLFKQAFAAVQVKPYERCWYSAMF
jgi:hypothetical protein